MRRMLHTWTINCCGWPFSSQGIRLKKTFHLRSYFNCRLGRCNLYLKRLLLRKSLFCRSNKKIVKIVCWRRFNILQLRVEHVPPGTPNSNYINKILNRKNGLNGEIGLLYCCRKKNFKMPLICSVILYARIFPAEIMITGKRNNGNFSLKNIPALDGNFLAFCIISGFRRKTFPGFLAKNTLKKRK